MRNPERDESVSKPLAGVALNVPGMRKYSFWRPKTAVGTTFRSEEIVIKAPLGPEFRLSRGDVALAYVREWDWWRAGGQQILGYRNRDGQETDLVSCDGGRAMWALRHLQWPAEQRF